MDETQNSNLLADVGRWRRRTEWIATIVITLQPSEGNLCSGAHIQMNFLFSTMIFSSAVSKASHDAERGKKRFDRRSLR